MSLLQKIWFGHSLFADDSLTGQVEMDEQNKGRKLLGSLQNVLRHLLRPYLVSKQIHTVSVTSNLRTHT